MGRTGCLAWANFSYPSLSGNMSNVSEANGPRSRLGTQGAVHWDMDWGTPQHKRAPPVRVWVRGTYAKLPAGQGFWPAIWMYGSNSSSEELDIMELPGGGVTHVYQTVHESCQCS